MEDLRVLEDKSFFEARDYLKGKYGDEVFSVADQFPLFSGTHCIARHIYQYELIKETLPLSGDIFEFGTWHGSTTIFISKILRLLCPQSPKKVYVFDNFEGLPVSSDEDGVLAKEFVGKYCGNLARLQDIITVNGFENLIQLQIGDARQTIPQFCDENSHKLVSLAYIDFDLYEPTKLALDFVGERLVLGGMIALDEGMSETWKGESQALSEFLADYPGMFEVLSNPLTRQPEIILRKIG
ncbi:TylF/MycF/NovP-related O-methyltransferase [Acaryochloris marina NIES-2412]|uniref:TylF/MycF/NovP-related O-methyltransferase n=1 Tax=Acaryochloris marina TaxID=155978 RepID=UPI004058AC6F